MNRRRLGRLVMIGGGFSGVQNRRGQDLYPLAAAEGVRKHLVAS